MESRARYKNPLPRPVKPVGVGVDPATARPQEAVISNWGPQLNDGLCPQICCDVVIVGLMIVITGGPPTALIKVPAVLVDSREINAREDDPLVYSRFRF